MHEGTGLSRRDIIQALKLLQTGIVVVVDQDSPNCDILKAPPYSAFPSQVEMYIDDKFHSFIGCAHEAVAVSNMPEFQGIEVRLESYCACCLEPDHPVVEVVRDPAHRAGRARSSTSRMPMWDWVHDDMKAMCDNTNLVIDAAHAETYERQIGRRGVLMTLDQIRRYVEPAVGIRGWDYHWPPPVDEPRGLIDRMRGLGVDLSPWGV